MGRIVCFLIMSFCGWVQSEAGELPNIIIMVADDLGWGDVSYHSGDIPTPHIDGLAQGGKQLDHFYVAPMCTPTRVGLLTGRYWSRYGNTNPSNTKVLPDGTSTIASELKEIGYTTHIIGKWHLGSKPEWGPGKYGFDTSYGSLAGGVAPWLHRYKKGAYSQTWHRNHEFINESGHVTDLLTKEALKTIKRHNQEEMPAFLYIPYTAVHNPVQEPDEWLERARKLSNGREHYSACVMHMDDSIGTIVQAIESEWRVRDNIYLFFSDNGGTIHPTDSDDNRYPGVYPRGMPLGQNKPLRGRKTELYQGGIRVPAFIHYKGSVDEGVIKTPIHVVDVFPTILALIDEKNRISANWDGSDRSRLILGKDSDQTLSHNPYYWLGVSRRSVAILEWPYKWISYEDKSRPGELFHLENDPFEKENLIRSRPKVRDRMRKTFQNLSKLDDTLKP